MKSLIATTRDYGLLYHAAMRPPISILSVAFVVVGASFGCQRPQPDATMGGSAPRSPQLAPVYVSPEEPETTTSENELFVGFVKSQLEGGEISFDSIVDRKAWPLATDRRDWTETPDRENRVPIRIRINI